MSLISGWRVGPCMIDGHNFAYPFSTSTCLPRRKEWNLQKTTVQVTILNLRSCFGIDPQKVGPTHFQIPLRPHKYLGSSYPPPPVLSWLPEVYHHKTSWSFLTTLSVELIFVKSDCANKNRIGQRPWKSERLGKGVMLFGWTDCFCKYVLSFLMITID